MKRKTSRANIQKNLDNVEINNHSKDFQLNYTIEKEKYFSSIKFKNPIYKMNTIVPSLLGRFQD